MYLPDDAPVNATPMIQPIQQLAKPRHPTRRWFGLGFVGALVLYFLLSGVILSLAGRWLA